MIKFYLINLDRSPERLAWMSRRLTELKIEFVRVPAIDGKLLEKDQLEHWEQAREQKFGLGPIELACFLSHRAVWQKVAQGEDQFGFIAEDDIHISDELPKFLESSGWIPSDAELVKAETVRQRVWLSKTVTTNHCDHWIRRLQSTHAGAAGYFLSRSGAAKMVAATANYCMSPDQVLFNLSFTPARKVIAYQIEPALVAQDWVIDSNTKFESLILNERNNYHVKTRNRNKSLAGLIWYKFYNPLRKLSKRSLEVSANLLGTHRVTKVAFEQAGRSSAA